MKISYGNSRRDKKWKNSDISWEDFCSRLETTIRTTETVQEYADMKKGERDEIKDVGGFVGGHLSEGRRRKGNVLCRSMLTLDMDFGTADVMDELNMFFPYRCCIYSTHKHTPDFPRLRINIPLMRDVSADEYPAIGRMVAKEIGIDLFDDTTYEPERLMYWPSTPSNGEYIYKVFDGQLLDPDTILAKYDDWKDASTWPVSSRQSEVIVRDMKKQEDPLEKSGVVGAFCRAYTITEAMAKFLQGIYEPSIIEGRYDYVPADSAAGVVVYDDKFSYSHHATDPACGKLLNSFDLVRVHKFTDEEDKTSFQLMCDFAVSDEQVKKYIAQDRMQQAMEEFENWEDGLQYDKKGSLINNLHNIRLILENDESLKGIVFNQLADSMEIKGDVPWNHPAAFWRDADDAQLVCYVEDKYGHFSARNYDVAVQKTVDDRSYHPIRSYLDGLPPWDGIERVDTLLIDYFGSDDNEYVRAVTRKMLCAAIRRVTQPGVKFDYILVMNGPQGIGKSTFIAKLGMDWYSDSLNLSDMNDKTAAEKLQGFWIMEIGELAGMKKADIDKVKAFVSRQDDKYRASFGRRVTPHPRQCVFFGTTNSETGFLRDVTGNRRFWAVSTPGTGIRKPWNLSQDDVDQIWAEALTYVKAGEEMYLSVELEKYANKEQSNAMEQDDREGIIVDYLELLLPETWDDMDVYARRDYVSDPEGPLQVKGTVRRTTVSNMEIWCECFGKAKEDMKPSDSYSISAIMKRIDGWYRTGSSRRIKNYGKQRIYERE